MDGLDPVCLGSSSPILPDRGTPFRALPPWNRPAHTLGDAHLYMNHFEQADLQLTRQPFPLPAMKLNPDVKSVFDFRYEDFKLENYQSHPAISAPIAV